MVSLQQHIYHRVFCCCCLVVLFCLPAKLSTQTTSGDGVIPKACRWGAREGQRRCRLWSLQRQPGTDCPRRRLQKRTEVFSDKRALLDLVGVFSASSGPGGGGDGWGVAEDGKHHKRRTVRVCGRRANGEQTALQLSVIESKLCVSAAELPFPSISFVVAASPTAVCPSLLFKTSRSPPLTFAPFVSTRVGFQTQTAAEYQSRVRCLFFLFFFYTLQPPPPAKPPPLLL